MNTNILQKEDYSTIFIGGVRKQIKSYKGVLNESLQAAMENIDDENNDLISPFQYQSVLFNNLGYDKCPSDSLWMNDYFIECAPCTEVLDYPICNININFDRSGTDLLNLLEVIYEWGYSRILHGFIIDQSRSYGNEKDNYDIIKYNADRNIETKMRYKLSKDEIFWNASNIYLTRLNQINPEIDEEYFKYSFKDMYDSFQEVQINDPSPIFALGLINPLILFSIIRSTEIEIAKYVTDKFCDGICHLREDESIIPLFSYRLNLKFQFYSYLYYKYGARAFVILDDYNQKLIKESKDAAIDDIIRSAREEKDYKKIYDPNFNNDDILEQFRYMDYNQKYQFIQSIDPYSKDVEKTISKYVDTSNLPINIDTGKCSVDNTISTKLMYENTMKRLYMILLQIDNNIPGFLSPNNKLIISKNLFIDNDRFSLYNKKWGRYIVVCPWYQFNLLGHDETINFYKSNYGFTGNIFLEKDEDSKVERIPDFVIPGDIEEMIRNDEFVKFIGRA